LLNNVQTTFIKFTKSLTEKDGFLWRTTHNILKYKSAASPIKNQDGSWAIDDIYKTETFREHLSRVFQPNTNLLTSAVVQKTNELLSIPLPLTLPPQTLLPGRNQNLYT